MESIIEKAKAYLAKKIKEYPSDPYGLMAHVEEVELWAKFILNNHPEADKEITLLGVWLHDIAHYHVKEEDHAITGEKLALEFLRKNKFPEERIKRVAHCVRAHRNKDCPPETIEAKIVTCADSASHLTDFVYFDIAMKNRKGETNYDPIKKMERDYRDLSIFPEVKEKLEGLHKAWRKILEEYEKLDLN